MKHFDLLFLNSETLLFFFINNKYRFSFIRQNLDNHFSEVSIEKLLPSCINKYSTFVFQVGVIASYSANCNKNALHKIVNK